MSTVTQDEGEFHTLQLHNLFFLILPELQLQLPKLALGFQAMPVTAPCPSDGAVWCCEPTQRAEII